jgi:hypothetical protein
MADPPPPPSPSRLPVIAGHGSADGGSSPEDEDGWDDDPYGVDETKVEVEVQSLRTAVDPPWKEKTPVSGQFSQPGVAPGCPRPAYRTGGVLSI